MITTFKTEKIFLFHCLHDILTYMLNTTFRLLIFQATCFVCSVEMSSLQVQEDCINIPTNEKGWHLGHKSAHSLSDTTAVPEDHS